MQIKLFTIPICDTGIFSDELNRFLRSNKILEVENHLISNENGASWCFCVKYIESAWAAPSGDRAKTDYRNELDPETFEIFSRLRAVRKQLALEEAIPAYAICTDQELAAMAKLKEISPNQLATIKGFGEKKLEKYGKRLTELYHKPETNEKSGEPV